MGPLKEPDYILKNQVKLGRKEWENRRGPTHSPRRFGKRANGEEQWTITQKKPQAAKHLEYQKRKVLW